jgi:hypothetical protein
VHACLHPECSAHAKVASNCVDGIGAPTTARAMVTQNGLSTRTRATLSRLPVTSTCTAGRLSGKDGSSVGCEDATGPVQSLLHARKNLILLIEVIFHAPVQRVQQAARNIDRRAPSVDGSARNVEQAVRGHRYHGGEGHTLLHDCHHADQRRRRGGCVVVILHRYTLPVGGHASACL